MSIVELSNSVDKLAKAVSEKNKELDLLKNSYHQKIDQLNQFIQLLALAVERSAEITEETLVDDYKRAITCSKCHSNVLFDDKYLVIPFGKIKDQFETAELSNKLHQLGISRSSNLKEEDPQSAIKPKKKERTKNKIVCSYCKKPGHTRAKCQARLSKPLET